ncbi:MAG: hypothetical protein U9N52_02695 [Campylobacterota bacterium]|nr:hypothetical protein [Campylobacterota bacterium]
MEYILHVRVLENKKRSYRITAKDEDEAKERLLTRLAPKERDGVIVDSIEIDPASLGSEEPYGIFLNDND